MADPTGKWNVVMSSPMGKQSFVADFHVDGDVLTGTTDSPTTGTAEIKDGKVDGDTLTFGVDLTKPMSLKMSFNFVLDGDTLTGKAKAGLFPAAKVKGERI
ncbi:hypothetical protein ACPPVQ_18880 [Diaminobutyricibacter sp. McL0618]|uniref:hypothetical protein n=1 Tax=Leifsonia sp. McL0618 TaxID=3415677 RepID=UPI003CE7F012